MMRYRFDSGGVIKKYNLDNEATVSHSSGVLIRLLPFQTQYSAESGKSFRGVVGEFSRLISQRVIQGAFDKDAFLSAVIDRVSFQKESDKDTLRTLIAELFVTSGGDLEPFHSEVFNYIPTEFKEHKRVAGFLFDIFAKNNPQLEAATKTQYDTTTQNPLTSLVVKSLPQIKKGIKPAVEGSGGYFKLPYVSNLFQEDLAFLLSDSRLFLRYFEMLLKYYYFFHASQLALKLALMFDANLETAEQVYFTLDWESVPRNRIGYTQGWKSVEYKVSQLFAHVNCLEMLNHTETYYLGPLTYPDLRREFAALSDDEKAWFIQQLDKLHQAYRTKINDVNWEQFHPKRGHYPDVIEQKIYELFHAIHFQFDYRYSKRNGAYKKYRNWFVDFSKENFLKDRNKSGYTLNLTQEYLMFLSTLVIKSNEKIRLKTLFEGLEQRGISFDWGSREQIIELFQKLNLLEKKSDSGDAQYVKSFL